MTDDSSWWTGGCYIVPFRCRLDFLINPINLILVLLGRDPDKTGRVNVPTGMIYLFLTLLLVHPPAPPPPLVPLPPPPYFNARVSVINFCPTHNPSCGCIWGNQVAPCPRLRLRLRSSLTNQRVTIVKPDSTGTPVHRVINEKWISFT